MDLEAGVRVDSRYVVVGLLGTGGMARVYRVRDERVGADRALKVLGVGHAGARERLLREGRIQGRLHHPNVVAVSDVVAVQGGAALVMELVDGPTLDAVVARGALPVDHALRLIRGIAAGVAAAHAHGLVHRDLKPGNVLLLVTDDEVVPKVTDFGLAKILADDPAGPGATRSGAALGTPRYMAPEQVRDASDVDERADVWALGALLYEALAGRPPFDGRDPYEVTRAVVEGRPEPLDASIPDDVRRAIDGALEPDRDRRMPTVEAFRAALSGRDPGRWAPADLERYRRPAPRGDTAPVSGRTLGTPETWRDDVDLVSTRDAPAPPRRARWLTGGLAALVALALAAWWAWPTERVLAPDHLVELRDGAAVSEPFWRGWRAFVASDDHAARRELDEALRAGATDPLVYEVAAASALALRDSPAFLDIVRRAQGRHPGDPAGQLMTDLGAHLDDDDIEGFRAVLAAHLEAHPDDFVAHAMRLSFDTTFIVRDGVATQARAFADRWPDAPVAWMLAAYGAPDPRPVLEEAEARLRAPMISTFLGDLDLRAGDFESAIRRERDALRAAPDDWAAHTVLAAAYLATGDEEAYRIHSSVLQSLDPVDADPLWIPLVATLETVGRFREAQAWRERLAPRVRAQTEVALRASAVRNGTDRWVTTPEELEARIEALRQVLGKPELAATSRGGNQALVAGVEGVIRARAGRPDPAGSCPGKDGGLCEIEGAAARGEPLPDPVGCTSALAVGELETDPARAESALRAATELCTHGMDTWRARLGFAGLAIRAAERGDPAAADRDLAELRRRWPSPDPDLPVFAALARSVGPRAVPAGAFAAWLAGHRTVLAHRGLEPVGDATAEAAALDLALGARLAGHADLVVVPEQDDVDSVGGSVARVGERVLLRLEREDPSGRILRTAWIDAASPAEAATQLDGALFALWAETPEGPVRHLVEDGIVGVRAAVGGCWARAEPSAPGGRLVGEWTVGRGGEVTSFRLAEDTVGVEAVGRCLEEVVRAVRWPPEARSVAVPFVLSR